MYNAERLVYFNGKKYWEKKLYYNHLEHFQPVLITIGAIQTNVNL